MNPDSIKTGGPAFPTESEHQSGHTTWHFEGMTLRDYFAAKAMQASRSRRSDYKTWADLAADAYEIADAMLAARAQNPEASHE